MIRSPFVAIQRFLQDSAYDQASEEMMKLDRSLQESIEGLRLWAFIFLKRQEWSRLEDVGRELQQKDPNDVRGFYCVAESFFRRGKAKEAIEIFKESEPFFKDPVAFLYTLSRLSIGAKEYENALRLMDQAYALAPQIKDTALLDEDFEPIWLELIDQQ